VPRESRENKKARTQRIIAGLEKAYPDAHCELNFSSPLELLIATILSAQCTDKRVNMVTPGLFQKYPDAAAFAAVSQEDLEEAIRSTGFYRNKAKSIRSMAADLIAKHGGQVPDTMEALTALAGVGRKTANVVLGNAFGKSEGVVVDTHVARLSQRLHLSKHKEPEKIEADLMQTVPRSDWTLFSHWLIWHGRRRCFARKPDCAGCEVQTLCPSAGKV
jgi:endonuclease-3